MKKISVAIVEDTLYGKLFKNFLDNEEDYVL
jgi:hypothetical protein